MRANDEAGANSARALRVPPMLGEVIQVFATVCERPGMVGDPSRLLNLRDVEPCATTAGVWVEIGRIGLTYKIWVPLSVVVVPAA